MQKRIYGENPMRKRIKRKISRKIKRWMRKSLHASFTIEAAVIVPLSLFLMCGLLIVAFAAHDKVILGTVSTDAIMERAANAGGAERSLQEDVQQVLSQRLIAAKEVSVQTTEAADGMSVTSAGNISVPLSAVRRVMGGDEEHIGSQINVSNLQSRETLLKYKAVCDGVSAIGKENGTDSGQTNLLTEEAS